MLPRGFIPGVGALQLLASLLLVAVCRVGSVSAHVEFNLASVEPDEAETELTTKVGHTGSV